MDTNIDFEGTEQTQQQEQTQQEEVTPLNHQDSKEDITGKDGTEQNKNEEGSNQQEQAEQTDGNQIELTAGQEIEFDGNTYTVSENGDVVDANGNVFKNAVDVKEWINSLTADEDKDSSTGEDEFDIKALQDKIGVEVTDENGEAVEFDNTPDGIKNYVDAVMGIKTQEIQEAAVNRVFAENPMLSDFIDYCRLNNGNPRGFGEIPDRSGIKLDKDNEAQQEYIIKMAAHEFGNNSLNDNYIKYLKDTNGLYDEAHRQLDNLVAKDKENLSRMRQLAEQQRLENEQQLQEYWSNVHNVIQSGKIDGYQIPESFICNFNNQKITLTRNDFFDYLSRNIQTEDGNTMTLYQQDLLRRSPEDQMNKELIDAWLMFTGGTYKDLLNMAVKEDKVKTLKLKSKEQKEIKPLRLKLKSNQKVSMDDILL